MWGFVIRSIYANVLPILRLAADLIALRNRKLACFCYSDNLKNQISLMKAQLSKPSKNTSQCKMNFDPYQPHTKQPEEVPDLNHF